MKQVELGRISGLFGVRGWVKVFSHTVPREAILDYDVWILGDREVRVIEGKRHGKSVIARLEGIEDRDQAATLIDTEISVDREALPNTDQGEYYWTDLEGLEVIHCDGTSLGKVAYLIETGANDVLVVKGEIERLVPFVMGQVVLEVDLEAGRIQVDWEFD